jgi:hypothetical protein
MEALSLHSPGATVDTCPEGADPGADGGATAVGVDAEEVNRLDDSHRDRHEESEDETDHCGRVSNRRYLQVGRERKTMTRTRTAEEKCYDEPDGHFWRGSTGSI